MRSEQQQQKGLFTFYREQADLEDQMKSRKRLLEEKLQKIEESQRKPNAGLKNKTGRLHKKNAKSLFQAEPPSAAAADSIRPADSKDKLMAILRRYNAKELKRKDRLRVIMEMQEEAALDQTEQLKDRLEKLLAEEDGSFELIQSHKQSQANQQSFMNKRECFPRQNPFQRLALIPTNFAAELQPEKDVGQPLKKAPSPPKALAYSLEVRKNDKVEASLQPRERYDSVCQMAKSPLTLNLPKIDMRSSSELVNKGRKAAKLGEKYFFEPISSERLISKSEISIFLQKMRLANQHNTARHHQNKIHSLFIENRQQGENVQKGEDVDVKRGEKGGSGELRLLEVVRRMKFS